MRRAGRESDVHLDLDSEYTLTEVDVSDCLVDKVTSGLTGAGNVIESVSGTGRLGGSEARTGS